MAGKRLCSITMQLYYSTQNPTITYLLLSHPELDVMIRDKSGWTPFATAMTYKDNKAAQAILDRAPTAADQARISVTLPCFFLP